MAPPTTRALASAAPGTAASTALSRSTSSASRKPCLRKHDIQAKRWDPGTKIGRPGVQAFFGALAGQRATKGLYITTSSFTKEAEQYAASVSGSLILVDGKRLVQLMIEHGLGVQTAHTLRVPKIDGDYFEG